MKVHRSENILDLETDIWLNQRKELWPRLMDYHKISLSKL